MTATQVAIKNAVPQLAMVSKKGIPMLESIMKGGAEGRTIASNKTVDRVLHTLAQSGLLSNMEYANRIHGWFPCWTGTMVACENSGKPLGDMVVYEEGSMTHSKAKVRWIFPVPKEHRGKEDVILVAEHPDYKIEVDGFDHVVMARNVDLVEMFPSTSGLYAAEPVHGIPILDRSHYFADHNSNNGMRRLWRGREWVGLIMRQISYPARGPDEDYKMVSTVTIGWRVSSNIRTLVEVPGTDISRIQNPAELILG